MTAFAADHVLDGGGLANYSASVAVVGGTAAIGIYDIPKVDVTTVAVHTRGVTAGSMRGYGTLQTMTALETLVDEAATELGMDPIELRRRNLLRTGGLTMNGNPWTVSVRTPGASRQARGPSDLARPRGGEGQRRQWRPGRHRRRLLRQGLRHRRRFLARPGGARRGRQHLHPFRLGRDGERHRNRHGQPGGAGPRPRRRRGDPRRARSVRRARARHRG